MIILSASCLLLIGCISMAFLLSSEPDNMYDMVTMFIFGGLFPVCTLWVINES